VSVCEWCSIGCRNEDEGHDDCELQTRQLGEVQRLISSSWRLCCTCQGKCANNIRLISIFTLKPGQDYWENRLGNSGITTESDNTSHASFSKNTHSLTHTHKCIQTFADIHEHHGHAPPRGDMMIISCCRKTRAALIRALDCPWGCDLTSRVRDQDNRLSSTAGQSQKLSSFKQ